MTIADVVLAIGLVLLFIIILGVMRETMILREQVTAFSQLIITPPKPQFLGSSLPELLAREINSDKVSEQAHVILFLSNGCHGCEALIKGLEQAIKVKAIAKENISCVVAASSSKAPLFQSARLVSQNTILDKKGALFKACEIKGTPTQFAAWMDNLQVFDYYIGGNTEWIHQKLQQKRETLLPTVTPS